MDQKSNVAPRRPRPWVVRYVALASAVLLLLGLAWATVSGGLAQLPRAHTPGQQVETAVQLACGLLSLLMVVTAFWHRGWARPIGLVWAVSLLTTAGLSSLVWGPAMPLVALAFAAAALLLTQTIRWLLRLGRTD